MLMKTMTCAQMGGTCDTAMTAATEAEMVEMGMAHIATAHPDMAEKVAAMTQEEKDAWAADFHAKWEAAPEDAAEEVAAPEASVEEAEGDVAPEAVTEEEAA